MFDLGFILAVGALGWGLSLATYPVFAVRRRWPMGQARIPQVPITLGALCVLLGVWAASRRIGGDAGTSGWLILVFRLA